MGGRNGWKKGGRTVPCGGCDGGKKTGREDVLGKENVVYSAFQNKSYKVLLNKSLEAAGIITHSETTKIRHEKLKF